MKEGWEIKKLGEVASFVGGGTPSKSIARYYEGNIKWATVRDMTCFQLSNTELCISQEAVDKSATNILPKGTIIISTHVGIGKICELMQDTAINQDLKGVILSACIDKYFFSYWYKEQTPLILSNATGATVKGVTLKFVNNMLIPVPPLSEQQRIVSELDCISGIIEKKKQQLKELDTLAQSIFHDMFGDPITNEKGWEVKKLKEVSTLLNGRAYQQSELLDKGKYKVLRVGNFFTNSSYYYSDLELDEDKYCDNGDLLFAWSASFGAFIWSGGKVIYHYHIWKVLFDEKQLNIEYYRCLLNRMTSFFMKDVHGIGMVHLTKVGMEQYDLPLPPLSLQQSFAAKVEAIEKQKALIKQSIGEAETLLTNRMDYYFN